MAKEGVQQSIYTGHICYQTQKTNEMVFAIEVTRDPLTGYHYS